MDIRKNCTENLAVLITSKSKKASANIADAFLLYSLFVTLLFILGEMQEPA